MPYLNTFSEITLEVKAHEESGFKLPMREFVSIMTNLVEIHDALIKIVFPKLIYLPSPSIHEISMHSPMWLQFISFKDIVEAITELLNIPSELRKRRLEAKKLETELKGLEQQNQNLETQNDAGSQLNVLTQRETMHRISILSEQLKQEKMKTLTVAHDSVCKVVEALEKLTSIHPTYEEQFVPLTFKITQEIIEIASNSLEVNVVSHQDTSIVPEQFKPLLSLLPSLAMNDSIRQDE